MPLQFELDELRLLAANYSYNPSINNAPDTEGRNNNGPENHPVKIGIRIGQSYNEETRNLKVRLKINSDDKELPFTFDIEWGGSFNIIKPPDKIEHDELEKLSRIWCAAIIYPYAREFISDLVRRGGNEPFFLPVLNFVNLYRDERKRKKIIKK